MTRCPSEYPGAVTLAGRAIACDDPRGAGHPGDHGNGFAARWWRDDDGPRGWGVPERPEYPHPSRVTVSTDPAHVTGLLPCPDCGTPRLHPRGSTCPVVNPPGCPANVCAYPLDGGNPHPAHPGALCTDPACMCTAGEDPPTCRQCGAPLSPVAAMLGPVCGRCCRANHRAVVGGSRR